MIASAHPFVNTKIPSSTGDRRGKEKISPGEQKSPGDGYQLGAAFLYFDDQSLSFFASDTGSNLMAASVSSWS